MTEIQNIALSMMIDPELDKTWREVFEDLRLDPEDDVPGERFCAVMRSCWAYTKLSKLIHSGDDEALAKAIEEVDPRRLVRDNR